MDFLNFKSKFLFNAIVLSFALLSMVENSAICNEALAKEAVCCNCRGEKKYINFSDLRMDNESIFLMGPRGVILVTELGCDLNGYYIYENDIDG